MYITKSILNHSFSLVLILLGSLATTIPGTAKADKDGKAVYDSSCVACHKTGFMGAPKLGDSTDWKNRLAQGKETLYQNAILGYTGKNGMMPAKGGNPKLSDDAVKSAVDYLVANSE